MRDAGFEPLEPFVKSILPWHCRCTTCGEESTPRHSNVRRGRGCTWCKKPRINPDEAARLMRGAGADPQEPYPERNDIPWRCVCRGCGGEVSPRYANIQQGRGPCYKCGRARARARRLAARQATTEELLRELGAEPLEPFPGRFKPWRMRCLKCGKVGSPMLGNVLQRNSPCKPCGRARGALARMLDPIKTRQIMLDAGFTPLVDYPGCDEPWSVRCSCGSETWPRFSSVAQGSRGCWNCAPRGFRSHKPSFVYLIENPGLGASKVGIANLGSSRIAQHARSGWEVRGLWHFTTGRPAQLVEQSALRHVRDILGLPDGARREDMPFGGATETWPTAGLGVNAALDLLANLVTEFPQLISDDAQQIA